MTSLDAEPCDDCDLGIALYHSYDGVRRCRNCIWELAVANGWDQPPDPPEPPPAPAPAPTPPPPLSPADRKALREEKKAQAAAQGRILQMVSVVCAACGNAIEPLYAMGDPAPVAYIGCSCPPPDPGVTDEEFEEYRNKILKDLP